MGARASWPAFADVHGDDRTHHAMLTPEDYDLAARCVNAHDELVDTIRWMAETIHRAHHDGELSTCGKSTCTAARDAIAKAGAP